RLRRAAWEMVHQLARPLEVGGESAAAELVTRLGAKAEAARELCYRLHIVRAQEARRLKPLLTTAWCRAGRRSCGWLEFRPNLRNRHSPIPFDAAAPREADNTSAMFLQ